MLGGCQRLKPQPHLASCDWSLITCRVKFHHWIKVKEGATRGGTTRKSDKDRKYREDDLSEMQLFVFWALKVECTALLTVIKINMNCRNCPEPTPFILPLLTA